MIALLQETQHQFYPETLLGWLAVLGFLLGTVATSVGTVWKLLMKPIHARIDAEKEEREKGCNGLGGRVTEIATGWHTAMGKVDLLERTTDRLSADATHLHERAGAAAATAENTRQQVYQTELKLLAELGAIRERVAATEAELRAHIAAQRRGTREEP